MFVNPVTNFNVANNYTNNFKNNKAQNNQHTMPKMNMELAADTVSFGADKKKKSKLSGPALAAMLTAATAIPSCTPDYESFHSLESHTTVNIKDMHKCGCDSFPIIIPGGRDTIYVEVPGETVRDTIYVEKPGETIRDTIYIDRPGETIRDTIYIDNPPDTIYVDKPVYDTIFVDRPVYDTIFVDRPVHDTIWIKPDTIYIPKKPYFEINDSINKDVEDFDIPSEGNGDFVYAMQGRNEYLGTQHLLVFNGFFSNERVSSFVDHAFEEDDIPEGGNKPSKYYYTRYDIGSDYENGRRVVTMWTPAKGQHFLPDDKKSGVAGWDYAGRFYVQNATVAETAKLIANEMDGTLKAKYTKNEYRGPGNIYKEWPLNDNQMPKTTIENVKVYRKDLDDLD